jgi:Ergosterol biosynthesis ERG4/ERG24 family
MVYGLQARYLVDFPLDLTTVQVVLIIALQLTGFYIFRSANSLKNQFRTNPNDPALKGQFILNFFSASMSSTLILFASL